ncbi:Ras [Parelaphostrongylus tenuis]|uniref:Ras n=1 Tax=Parelaphostrongylus tenuis TaxID=148309 RepID=A0AAD5M5N3_PARTN|nr:Ras [Parelaphostrongylus tenuis]
MSEEEKKQYSFKILVIGDPGTGKTSIIRRYVHDVFTTNYKSTIGVDFAMKSMVIDDDVQVYLQLWDISEYYRANSIT